MVIQAGQSGPEQAMLLEPRPSMRRVKIRVKGRLDKHWSEWFDGFKISYYGEDETVLSGPFRDQAALYSILTRLRDLGLGLVSLKTMETSPGRD